MQGPAEQLAAFVDQEALFGEFCEIDTGTLDILALRDGKAEPAELLRTRPPGHLLREVTSLPRRLDLV